MHNFQFPSKAAFLLFCTLSLSSSECSNSSLPPIQGQTNGYHDINFCNISLSYNLSIDFLDSLRINGRPNAISDYYALNSYHPSLYMTRGTVSSFEEILRENADYSTCEVPPSVNFTFWKLGFSSSIPVNYQEYDYYLCYANQIKDAPCINSEHIIDCTVKTAKATNGIQLLWSGKIYLNGYNIPAINGVLSLPKEMSAFSVIKSGVGNSSNGGNSSPRQDVAIGDDERYDPVGEGGNTDHANLDDDSVIENTVSENLPGGDYYLVPSDIPLTFSPVLLQHVYSGGSFHDNLRWSEPRRAILDPVEDEDGKIGTTPTNSLGIITIE